MTRDQAVDIIANAILTTPAGLGEVDETAWRIATALDALGLLTLATGPAETDADRIAAAARIVSGNPLPNSIVGPEAEAQQQQRADHAWAQTRTRT
jgi:hypothetical protein